MVITSWSEMIATPDSGVESNINRNIGYSKLNCYS